MSVLLDSGGLLGIDGVLEPIRYLCVVLGRQGSIRLVHELSGGYTGARVFLAEEQVAPDDPQPFHWVFKVGPGKLLREEVEHYLRFLPYARAHKAFAQIFQPKSTLETLANSDLIGAILYEHAAAPFARTTCISLKEMVAQAFRNEIRLEEVEEVLSTTVQAIGSLYSTPTPAFAFELARYYLDRWAPDFHLTIEEAVDVNGQCLLKKRRLNPAEFHAEPITPPEMLRKAAESPLSDALVDFVIPRLSLVRTTETGIIVHGPTSDALSLELDLSSVSPETRQKINTLRTIALWTSSPAQNSRHEFYQHCLLEVFLNRELGPSSLIIGGRPLQNPLRHLSVPLIELTRPPNRTRLVPAHGDLHPGNVLVVGNTPVIIDYGLADPSLPVGIDSARLFGGLVRDVFSELLPLEDLASVLLALLDLELPPEDMDTPAGRAWRLLKLLQTETRRISGEGSETLWPLHLHGFSFIGLKWNAEAPTQHRACCLLAAVALTKLLGWPKLEDTDHSHVTSHGSIKRAKAAESSVQNHTTEREIQIEGPAEILILVARFAGSAEYDPTARIYEALADHLFEVIPDISRVEQILTVISSRKDAIALAERYQASMVVWGTYDHLGIRPRYEVTRDSLVMKKSMIQLDQATRHQLKDKFDVYITDNLAAEVSFLSLQAVGDMCTLNLNYQAATDVYERALALLPDQGRAIALGASQIYSSLAGVYFSLKRYDQALSANSMARKLSPNDILLQLQWLMLRSVTEKRTGTEMLEELRDLLQKRIEDSLTETDEKKGLARALETLASINSPQDLKRMTERPAGDVLSLAIEGHPQRFSKDVSVHLNRALVYGNAGQYSKALKELRLALRLNPLCVPALVGRANMLAILDRIPQALHDLDYAEKIDPSFEVGYLIRAWILVGREEYSDCLEILEKGIALGLPWERYFEPWAISMLALDRGEEVMSAFKSHEIDPNAALFRVRSRYYRKKGQYKAALREANQAIDLRGTAGNEGMNYEERAKIHTARGQIGSAIEDLHKAIEASTPGTFLRRKLQKFLDDLTNRASSISVAS